MVSSPINWLRVVYRHEMSVGWQVKKAPTIPGNTSSGCSLTPRSRAFAHTWYRCKQVAGHSEVRAAKLQTFKLIISSGRCTNPSPVTIKLPNYDTRNWHRATHRRTTPQVVKLEVISGSLKNVTLIFEKLTCYLTSLSGLSCLVLDSKSFSLEMRFSRLGAWVWYILGGVCRGLLVQVGKEKQVISRQFRASNPHGGVIPVLLHSIQEAFAPTA